jgi:phosphate transport system permease protein
MDTTVAPVSETKTAPKKGFQMSEAFAHLGTMAFAGSILVITVLVVFVLILKSKLAISKFGWSFFAGTNWDPVMEQFGAWPFVYGTLITSFLGLGAAIFLAELAPPKLSSTLTFLVELLAAVPSVIYGLLAIFTVVPLMRDYVEPSLKTVLGFLPIFSGQIYGVGYLTAAFVLAIMTFPFIISISREALLGATKWESTYQIVVPNATFGIVGAVFLGLARALGETMAVTMVIGNSPQMSKSLFAAGYTIPAVIANEFSEAGSIHAGALVLLALVLFMITMVINAVARLLLAVNARRSA